MSNFIKKILISSMLLTTGLVAHAEDQTLAPNPPRYPDPGRPNDPGRPDYPDRPGYPDRPERPDRPGYPDRPGENRVVYQNLGTGKTAKIINQTFRFYPNNTRNRVWSIRLVGVVNTTRIEAVQVRLRDGSVHNLPELSGYLRANRTREAYLGGERIREVRVTATSGNLTGSPAQFRVQAGIIRSN